MPTEMPKERAIRQPGSMELDPSGDGLAIDETIRLIASSKVEGTAVYDEEGEQLGTVFNFMVDKISGQVAYVVMSFGGFLGIGERYHPLPWKALRYDPRHGGYVIPFTKDRLQEGPSHTADENPFADAAYGTRVDGYYANTASR